MTHASTPQSVIALAAADASASPAISAVPAVPSDLQPVGAASSAGRAEGIMTEPGNRGRFAGRWDSQDVQEPRTPRIAGACWVRLGSGQAQADQSFAGCVPNCRPWHAWQMAEGPRGGVEQRRAAPPMYWMHAALGQREGREPGRPGEVAIAGVGPQPPAPAACLFHVSAGPRDASPLTPAVLHVVRAEPPRAAHASHRMPFAPLSH